MKTGLVAEAFVLAGGKSSRMGKDKGRISFQGKPMISHVLETLGKLGLPVKIIANEEAYSQFGYPVVPDIIREKGPMGGLLTAFENTQGDHVLLLSGDMPFIQEEIIQRLLQEVGDNNIIVAEVEGRINPLPGIYPVSLQEDVADQINSHQLKMGDFISENRHTLVPSGFSKKAIFFRNINTPQELREAEEQWNKFK